MVRAQVHDEGVGRVNGLVVWDASFGKPRRVLALTILLAVLIINVDNRGLSVPASYMYSSMHTLWNSDAVDAVLAIKLRRNRSMVIEVSVTDVCYLRNIHMCSMTIRKVSSGAHYL